MDHKAINAYKWLLKTNAFVSISAFNQGLFITNKLKVRQSVNYFWRYAKFCTC